MFFKIVMVYVTKANGEQAPFEKEKIIRTCIRSGLPRETAERIADKVASNIYDGISTRKILDQVLKELKEYESHHKAKYDLRRAVADLSPEFHEFEKYVTHLFRAHGYKTQWDKIIQGECIEHQIDIVAEKAGKAYLVECKHHVNQHRLCGLGTTLQTWAAFDDIHKGPNGMKYNKVWLFINTKFSAHSIKYATAKNMILTGWNYPEETALREMISQKSVYPITILELSDKHRDAFANAGIFLLNELVSSRAVPKMRKTGIGKRNLEQYIKRTREILGG